MRRVYLGHRADGGGLPVDPGGGGREAEPAVFRRHGVAAERASARSLGPPTPDEEVSVFDRRRQRPHLVAAPPIKADKIGRWAATLGDVAPAGGPFTLTIKGKNTVTVKDVLVGEVWVASGQSNMEMNLASCPAVRRRSPTPGTPRSACSPWHKIAAEPTTELQGKWVECGPDTVCELLRRGLLLRPRPAKGAQRARRRHRVQLGRHRRRGLDAESQPRIQPRPEKSDSRRNQDRRQEAQPQPGDGPL